MSARAKPRAVDPARPVVDAREGVCHVSCSLAAPLVTMRFTCVSAPIARRLFDEITKAVRAGEVSLALPAPPADRGQS